MTKEEMEQQIHDFAELMYRTGVEDGYKNGIADGNISDGTFAKKIQEAYENGLNNVWEYVEKLGQLTIKEIYEIFGVEYDNIYGIIADYTPSEFIKAIKAYEEQKNEIHVGDEVVSDAFDEKGIVTHINDKNCVSLICGMSSMINTSLDKVHKTGKSYPQIVEILEQLKGDKE